MAKSNAWGVFSKWDGYAQGVGLLYERKPRFQTPCGGICTLISLSLILYWTTLLMLGTFIPPGNFNVKTNTRLIDVDLKTQLYQAMEIPI